MKCLTPQGFSAQAHRPPYAVRVAQELRVMSHQMEELHRRSVPQDQRSRVQQSLETLSQKYEAARLAFHRWQADSVGERVKQQKVVDEALVDMRKFYTKVMNRCFRT